MDQKEVVELIEAEETAVSTEVIASSRKKCKPLFYWCFFLYPGGDYCLHINPERRN
jgi:hypothetical protein